MRTPLLVLGALAVAACGGPDRRADSAAQTARSAAAPRGPDNLVLRVARGGGTARVYAYPRLDTVVWSAGAAPAPARVFAFDEEAGTIAYVDAKGQPARIDFRQGSAATVSRTRLTGITSSDGSAIYAVAADGQVQRYAPATSVWKWKPPLPARALFPQPDASLLVLGERTGGSVVWRLRPPSTDIVDSAVLPRVDRALRTQVGDRLYLGAQRELAGIRTRTMERTPTIAFDAPIEVLAATPSGDRVFVVTRDARAVRVVDRYREEVSGTIELGRVIDDLRVDPLGRYLLVHPAKSDSTLVVALATNRVVGAVLTAWRADLPFVAPDGGIALAQGADVIIVDGESLRPTTRVRAGAADFWYPFRWTGFRPRAAALDRPVEFEGPVADSAAPAADSAAPPPDSAAAPATPAPPRDTAPRRAPGYTVSFAALLVPEKARELASQIRVGGQTPRVVAATRDGATIYRVVLGPFATREEADRVGRESRQSYWVYEGGP